MYEIKPSIPPEDMNSNVPFRERLHLTKGLEDFEKTKETRLKKVMENENDVQKNNAQAGKTEKKKVEESINKRRMARESDGKEITRQQAEDLSEMLGEAVSGKKGEKIPPEEIVKMSDTKIQEVIESKVIIEPYQLDEWVYMMT